MDIEIYEMVIEAQRLLKTEKPWATNDQLQHILDTFEARAEHQYELSQVEEMNDEVISAVFGESKVEVD